MMGFLLKCPQNHCILGSGLVALSLNHLLSGLSVYIMAVNRIHHMLTSMAVGLYFIYLLNILSYKYLRFFFQIRA